MEKVQIATLEELAAAMESKMATGYRIGSTGCLLVTTSSSAGFGGGGTTACHILPVAKYKQSRFI